MSKELSKLQTSVNEVRQKVDQTNSKINELGSYTYCLNTILSIIQDQFDRIRNIPSDKQEEYEKIKEIRLKWKQQVDQIDKDYKDAQTSVAGGAAAGVGIGVGVIALGPTAAMSIATTFGIASTGTAISTLSGAAATNAALAWLGGGTLAAGGGGISGGSALLALAGPVGWFIAGGALVGSGLLFLKNKSDKKRLENIFISISKRDIKTYDLAIVELTERIKRITNETNMLSSAIVEIGSFGADYTQMTEQQQYALGTYFNLIKSTTQLLVNPIKGLQPRYSEKDFSRFTTNFAMPVEHRFEKDILIYFANLLAGIKLKLEEKDLNLLAKTYSGNKEWLENMKIDKKIINLEFMKTVDRMIRYKESMKYWD